MDEMAGAVAALGILAFAAFLVWIRSRNRDAYRGLLLERQKQILEKLGSGVALAQFLASDDGARLLAQLGEIDKPTTDVRRSIAAAVTAGIVSICAGIGLLTAARYLAPFADSDYWFLIGLALLAIGVGVGLLIASGVSHYLSRKWGLIKN
jgi:hypothetical protein